MTKSVFNYLGACLFILFNFWNSNLNAQQCGTNAKFEQWKNVTPNWQEQISVNSDNNHVERRDGKKIIPVVFHIINTNGPENISTEQIKDAIRILNLDFNKQNSDWQNVRNTPNAPFLPLVADMEIEFQLAKKDPQGNCTNGINRIFSSLHIDAGDNIKQLVKWPVNRYLNIWVVSTISNFDGGGIILGYSNFPWMSASSDGIVMRSDAIGSIGTANPLYVRALTHEVGHYFGLMHTFQGGCSESDGGDLVDDTPPVAAQFSNTSCNITNKSCTQGSFYDQWENFMDYSHGCQSMFTVDQKSRVQAFLVDNRYTRKNLYTIENLEFTGITPSVSQKPLSFFDSDVQLICAGSSVQFFDNSCNGNVTHRTWEFQGGDIQSSNQPSPIVTYDEPGEFNVKLTTSNSLGSSTYEINKYIKVVPKIAQLTGIYESFEDQSSFSLEGITQLSFQGFGTFENVGVGYFGNRCLRAPISIANKGSRFILETPYLNISKMSGMNPKISFMVGYGRRNATNNDYIRILISDDCGNTWKQKYQRISAQFSSSNGYVTNFTPSHQGEWKRLVLNLSEYQNITNLKIRIEIESGGGNPIYIDDINISQYFTSTNPIENESKVHIFPNPGNDFFNIQLSQSFINKNTSIRLFDITGKEISQIFEDIIDAQSLNFILYPRHDKLKPGIYFIKIETDEGILTKRLIFAD
ncbi:MAG: T9SS type A sorting domain-containing protein [Bacteroidetes bacterium]|nr:T9SS type A sorting domain-containing protein [Bacteroidota bacterium]